MGAGIDCPACGSQNRTGARFCDACGDTLAVHCDRCANELRSGARFCDRCGTPTGAVGTTLPPRDPTPAESRKVVTIVFADLAGSTQLQERMDAESARRVMDRFYSVMRQCIDDHGGRVVKFMGDGVMAVFGVPTVGEDDAARAVRAAAAMHDAFAPLADEVARERDARIALRVGANTGEVVVSEGDDDVVGDAANVAARLEHAAGEGAVLVGEETWRLTRDRYTFEPVPQLDVKGKAEPVTAFRLASLDPPASEGVSPFVGREAQIARLIDQFDRAVATNRPHLVTVVGSPGLGKSRLADEFVRRIGERATVVGGRCDPGGSATFAPVADVLRQAAGIDDTATPDAVQAALTALFPDGAAERDRIAALAASVLGVGSPGSPEETFWAIRRVFEQLADVTPVVVVLDDLHWAEPMFLDLVEHLAEWTRDAPVLLLVTARPEIRDVRPGLADVSGRPSDVVLLDPLDETAGAQLTAELLDGRSLPGELAGRLFQAAEGNPLFLRELIRMLVDDGVLRLEDGVWVSTTAVTDITVPPTIQALLSARIERLGSDERDVVERASVVGKQFYRGAVATLAPPPVASRLDAHLETLRRKELVEPDGTYWVDEPVFRFHHSLIRDAAYRRLLKEARADLHERFAAWLIGKVGDLVGEHEEVIGYHLEQAFRYHRELGTGPELTTDTGNRASTHLAAAARRALDRDDHRSASDLLARALECLEPGAPARGELLLDRCEALLSLGDVAVGAESTEELRHAAAGSPRLSAWADAFVVQLGAMTDPANLRSWAERARAATEELDGLGDAAGVAKAAAVHASILARLGQIGACESALDRALAAAREAADRRRANAVLAGAPMAALWGPSPVTRASGRCLDVVRVLRITTDSPSVEAVALRAQAVLEAMRGRFDAARRLLAGSQRLLEELGQRSGLLHTDLSAGIVELLAGDPGAAEQALRRSYEGFRELGVRVDAAQSAALLGRACLAQGRDGEALDLSGESERLGGDDLKTSIAWRAVRAEALGRRGQYEEALRLAREAVAIAGETDAPVDHADARMTLALVLRSAGQAEAAVEEARVAVSLYESKEATVAAEAARTLLGGAPAPDRGDMAELSPGATGTQWAPRNFAVSLWERTYPTFATRDIDATLALLASDFVLEERQSQALTRIEGREEMRSFYEAMFEVEIQVDIEWEVVATRGEHLWLGRLRSHIRDRLGGTATRVSLGVWEVDDDGLTRAMVMFDADDLDPAFEELDRRYFHQLGDAYRSIYDLTVVTERAYNARAWDDFRAQLSDDFVLVDHRPAGWGQLGADDYSERMQELARLSDGVDLRVSETVCLRPQLVLATIATSGTDSAGAAFEITFRLVAHVRDGKFDRYEFFSLEQHAEALACFDELVGDCSDGREVDTPAMLAARRFADRLLAGDVEGALLGMHPDITIEDRRPMLGEAQRGREQVRRLVEQLASGILSDVDVEVLGTWGDRLALTRRDYHIASSHTGPSVVSMLTVDEVDEAGLLTGIVSFEPDDIDAAEEEIDGRFARQAGPACAPIARLGAEARKAFNAHDRARMAAVFTDGFVMHDHRPGGWGELDVDAYLDRVESLGEVAPDARLMNRRIVLLTPTAILTASTISGAGLGGAPFEISFLLLMIFADGRFNRYELLDASQEAAARARVEALTSPAGAQADLPLDNLAVRTARAGAAEQPGRVDVDPVAVRGDRLALLRVRRTTVAEDAVGSSYRVDEVDEAGSLIASQSFDLDDVHAALDELDRRYAEHVDPACRPLVAAGTAIRQAYNRRDWHAIRATFVDDLVAVDHRATAWGTLDLDGYVEILQGLTTLAPDVVMSYSAIPRLSPDACVTTIYTWGTDANGGRFEISTQTVIAFADGRFTGLELFEPWDHAGAIARFEELTRLEQWGLPVRTWDGMVAALRARQFAVVDERLAPDFRQHDHPLGVALTRDEHLEQLRRVWSTEGLQVSWEPIGQWDRMVLVRMTHDWSTAATGGPWSATGSGSAVDVFLHLFDEQWRFAETHRFADDQVDLALELAEQRLAEQAADR